MKNFWHKLGLRKLDEMEQYIVIRAERNAYIFLTIALSMWTFYESARVFLYHTPLNLIPCGLLVMASLIQNFSQLVMTRNAVKDDEDSYQTGPFLKILIFVCTVAAIAVSITAIFILMGVRV